jgi:hypothetical protein
MAEEKIEPRETGWRQLLPWTELFRGFQVALDLNKLALAAAGILVMAFGWWLLSSLFTAGEPAKPKDWSEFKTKYSEDPRRGWDEFKQAHDHWNLMQESAGVTRSAKVDTYDLIQTYDENERYEKAIKDFDENEDVRAKANKQIADANETKRKADRGELPAKEKVDDVKKEADEKIAKAQKVLDEHPDRSLAYYLQQQNFPETKANALAKIRDNKYDVSKPYGRLSTWPWFEDRGPNPFLLLTGQLGKPWEVGHFWDWFFINQAPVLVEPVVKLFRPVVYFFSPGADWYSSLYFLLMMLWLVATWSFFGGAITRIAAVQVARGEKIGLVEALRFVCKRYLSYLTAPLFPVAFVFAMLVVLIVFGGIIQLIPLLGDLWSGLFWGVWIVIGLLMAVALVGLVGWPLMAATISAEGTDSWEAVSRAFSYVFQKPWNFVWYSLVAVAYGAVVVFFVGFMGSFAVYLTKWAVSETPFIRAAGREPSYLFVYAPESFGWRTLLLQGAKVDGDQVVANGEINPSQYNKLTGFGEEGREYRERYAKNHGGASPPDQMVWWNHIGAFLVAVWLYILFLLILGFGYSYFWTASIIVYLLLRKNVDAAELDEVYLEEDEAEGAPGGPLTAPAPPPTAVKPAPSGLTMVEAPSLRPTPPPGPVTPAGPSGGPPPAADLTAPPAPPETAAAPPAGGEPAAPPPESGEKEPPPA